MPVIETETEWLGSLDRGPRCLIHWQTPLTRPRLSENISHRDPGVCSTRAVRVLRRTRASPHHHPRHHPPTRKKQKKVRIWVSSPCRARRVLTSKSCVLAIVHRSLSKCFIPPRCTHKSEDQEQNKKNAVTEAGSKRRPDPRTTQAMQSLPTLRCLPPRPTFRFLLAGLSRPYAADQSEQKSIRKQHIINNNIVTLVRRRRRALRVVPQEIVSQPFHRIGWAVREGRGKARKRRQRGIGAEGCGREVHEGAQMRGGFGRRD